jgi:hypothetical protein
MRGLESGVKPFRKAAHTARTGRACYTSNTLSPLCFTLPEHRFPRSTLASSVFGFQELLKKVGFPAV